MKSVCISNMIRRTILKRCLYDFRDVTTLNRGNVLSKAVGQPSLPETSKLLLNNIGRHQRLSGNNWCNEIGSSPKCGTKNLYWQLDCTPKAYLFFQLHLHTSQIMKYPRQLPKVSLLLRTGMVLSMKMQYQNNRIILLIASTR